ncbi:MAG: hypothetical protein MUE73_21135 [Planctomycetes bacterium]|jgi:hypothetical protein|nr:hypothetical protein [Planctomycetota bacterium]
MVTETELNGTVGQHISAICGVGFHDDNQNHCAHYVSHLLGLRRFVTCRALVRGAGTPATIRVDDVFRQCVRVGVWADLPPEVGQGLVFLTNPVNVNVSRQTMSAVRRKHVGIFMGPARQVFHYDNDMKKVVRQTIDVFRRHYPPPDDGLFFGLLI